MRVEATKFSGLLVIDPQCFGDDRGFFMETFQVQRYRGYGIAEEFVQDNHSRSEAGVLRGLHFQVKRPHAQIVTVMRGQIFDVAVDLRRDSSTFGEWYGVELSEDGPRQIYMAPGFAHGFCVLSKVADLYYKVSGFYDQADEGGVVWNDPRIGVRWPVDQPVLSNRDRSFPMLGDLDQERLPHCE